ncbi:amino acid transporter [Cupriavidus sp. UYMMa02A]|nr:amino acid transporter [Cupriavidus sp. UYMMa02A]
MQDWLQAMQWPAMVATVIATWLVGSRSSARRRAGFWIFLASNILWIAWGWQGDAYALMLLQVALVAMNVRGMREARKAWRDMPRSGVRDSG